jgi:hypothetical protein
MRLAGRPLFETRALVRDDDYIARHQHIHIAALLPQGGIVRIIPDGHGKESMSFRQAYDTVALADCVINGHR